MSEHSFCTLQASMTLQPQWTPSIQWKADMQQLSLVTALGVSNLLCMQPGWQKFRSYMSLTLDK